MLKSFAAFGIATLAIGFGLSASANPLAETYSPDPETIVGGRTVFLPSVPVTPWYYALPMEITMVQDTSITSNTPLSDTYATDLQAWYEAVNGCLTLYPAMNRATIGGDVPFLTQSNLVFDDEGNPVAVTEGTIVLNANGVPVCPL